jgi:hypothetical protein
MCVCVCVCMCVYVKLTDDNVSEDKMEMSVVWMF